MRYRSVNPATEELLESFELAGEEEVEAALDAATTAHESWRRLSAADRARPLLDVAELLQTGADRLARTMAVEMGKPLAQGRAEAEKCAWVCRWYANEAPRLLEPSTRSSDGSRAYVRRDPLGPILAIMPWNFPLWQFFRFAAPALMAGNTAILKHAPNTPRCGREIESVCDRAGMPRGVVRNLYLDEDQVARVIADDRLRGVTLTGSTTAGSEVASVAGHHLKKTVLELGGSDPFIVMEDADLAAAVAAGVEARCQNSGQSCIAAKRFLVHRAVYDEFAERLVAGMESRVLGDPLRPGVDVGPLARADLRDRLAAQVTQTINAGARALCGASPPDMPGFFYPPTVLTDVEPWAPAALEELFGPVAALMPFRTDEEAIDLANSTSFGLGASVWSTDVERVEALAADLECGSVFVNGVVKSDPRLPFGGVKASGFGRELSTEGLLEFTNAKTVWIR